MPRLEYTARTLTGDVVTGKIRANSEYEARSALSERGFEVLTLGGPGEAGAEGSGRGLNFFRGRLSSTSLASATAQLSLMLRSGTSLVEALDALAEQTQDARLYDVLVSVRDQVAGGSTLAAALAAHPRAFDTFYVSAVRAGEVSGRLPDIFARLEQTLRKRVEMKTAVIISLIYPSIISVLAIFAVVFVMTYVLPKFVTIFESSHVPLPVPTQILMGISGFLVSYWYLAIAVSVGVPSALWWYVSSPKGSIAFDGLILRLPLVGSLTTMLQTALMLRTLGTLLSSGVGLLEGLDVARDACKNTRFKRMIQNVVERVTQGEDLSSSFGKSELLPPTTKQMLTTGERSGNLAKVMNSLAEHLDEEADKQLKKVSAIIEPLIIIAMGVAVGFIAVSILLPLFRLTSAARGGA